LTEVTHFKWGSVRIITSPLPPSDADRKKEDFFSLALSQLKKNITLSKPEILLGIFQSLKLRISMENSF